MVIGSLALAAAGALVGAAAYVNTVEQPARLALDDEALAKEWEPSDHRGFVVLAALALISAVFGFIAYRELDDVRWILGALVVLATWPYAYVAIVPLNNRILALIDGEDVRDAREVIKLWGRLEIGQAAIGLAAVGAYIWAGA